MTTDEFAELTKYADFGRMVVELAKEKGFVPKRAKARVKIVERVKVVRRRARRTKAEIEAARAAEILAPVTVDTPQAVAPPDGAQ